MQSAFLLASLVAVALAQAPSCYNQCFSQSPTSCSPSDWSCLCNSDSFLNELGDCVLDSSTCSISGSNDASEYLMQQCATVGVTITITQKGSEPPSTKTSKSSSPSHTSSNPASPTGSPPACLVTCDEQSPSSCATGDFSCLCNDNTYLTELGHCVLDSGTCATSSQVNAATVYFQQTCAAVGVTITITTDGSSNPTPTVSPFSSGPANTLQQTTNTNTKTGGGNSPFSTAGSGSSPTTSSGSNNPFSGSGGSGAAPQYAHAFLGGASLIAVLAGGFLLL